MSVFNQTDYFFSGDSQEIAFLVEDDSGIPIDLTGHTIKMRFARILAGPTILQKTSPADFDMTNAANGEVVTEIDGADTVLLGIGQIYWQLEDEDQIGNKTIVAAGTLLGLTKLPEYVAP